MKAKKYKYMHLMDGAPARYNGRQICYATRTWPVKLVSDLKTIKRQQRLSEEWRDSLDYPSFFEYDYVRVLI